MAPAAGNALLDASRMAGTAPSNALAAAMAPAAGNALLDTYRMVGTAPSNALAAAMRASGYVTTPPRPRSFIPEGTGVAVNNTADLGQLIKFARRNMRLNQQQFADLAGVGRRFISELESGKSTMEIGLVLKVCRTAGIDLQAKRR
jgi:y4mF family transcriptional regulator